MLNLELELYDKICCISIAFGYIYCCFYSLPLICEIEITKAARLLFYRLELKRIIQNTEMIPWNAGLDYNQTPWRNSSVPNFHLFGLQHTQRSLTQSQVCCRSIEYGRRALILISRRITIFISRNYFILLRRILDNKLLFLAQWSPRLLIHFFLSFSCSLLIDHPYLHYRRSRWSCFLDRFLFPCIFPLKGPRDDPSLPKVS